MSFKVPLENDSRKAVVTAIKVGHNGHFFSAKCDIGKVTVSLKKPVWQEDNWPEGGTQVIISDIRRNRAGWRAYSARFLRPGDEELPKKEDQNQTEVESMSVNQMDDEARRKRVVTLVQWGVALVAGFVVAPYVFLAIGGLVGLGVAAIIAFAMIQFAPVVAMKIANQKIKMIVQEAEENPIETMKSLRVEKQQELNDKHQQIVDFETEVSNYNDETAEFARQYPDEASRYEAISKKMQEHLEKMKADKVKAEDDMHVLVKAIEKAEALYKMALAAQRVTQFTKSAEQIVFQDIKQKVAFDSVRNQVNRSFAMLNNSVGQRAEIRSQATFALPTTAVKEA